MKKAFAFWALTCLFPVLSFAQTQIVGIQQIQDFGGKPYIYSHYLPDAQYTAFGKYFNYSGGQDADEHQPRELYFALHLTGGEHMVIDLGVKAWAGDIGGMNGQCQVIAMRSGDEDEMKVLITEAQESPKAVTFYLVTLPRSIERFVKKDAQALAYEKICGPRMNPPTPVKNLVPDAVPFFTVRL